MRAGSMRERVVFYALEEYQTPSGAVKKDWKESYKCRAFYKKATPVYDKDGVLAREEFRGDNIYLVIRKTGKVNDLMRVEYNGNMHDIIPPIEPNHRDHTLQIQIRRLNE
jgi:SPP1 family predicted phage head-tail adaptor